MLADFGASTQSTGSGEQAIGIVVREGQFDAILVDAVLETSDGYETAAGIRALPWGFDLPIVMLIPALARRREQARLRDVRINAVVQKPIRRDALLAALSRALGIAASAPPASCATIEAKSLPDSLLNTKVLVVEDNPTNLSYMAIALRKAGLEVFCAESGEQALALLESQQVSIILMDIQMPGMDGYAATCAIRQMPRFKDIPIVAVTAHASPLDQEKCLRAGMSAYLPKPVDRTQLIDTIVQVLQRTSAPTHAPVPKAIPIDIYRLADDTDWDFALSHVQRFLENARNWLGSTREAASVGDFTAAGRFAHKIRGGAVQMPIIASTATDLMQACRDADSTRIADCARAVDEALSSAANYLLQCVSDASPASTRSL
jgi:CheY-like chemotaxis protein